MPNQYASARVLATDYVFGNYIMFLLSGKSSKMSYEIDSASSLLIKSTVSDISEGLLKGCPYYAGEHCTPPPNPHPLINPAYVKVCELSRRTSLF